MKSFVLPLSLALGVMGNNLPTLVERDSPSVVERDIAAVTSAVTQVDSGIKNLDSAIQSFNGDASQMNSAAESLVNTLRTATTQIQQTSNISVADALSLQGSVMSLQTDGMNLINDLEAKRPAIESASLCDTVLKQTTGISTAAQALISAVISKLPESIQSVGNQLASGVVATLQRPVLDFSPGNCTNASGSSGSGGSATGTTQTIYSTATASAFSASTFVSTLGNATTATFASPTGTSTPFTVSNDAAPIGASGPVGLLAVAVAAMIL